MSKDDNTDIEKELKGLSKLDGGIPEHLKLLGTNHTGPIRRHLNSFENALWLAFLRGKHAGEEKVNKVIEQVKKFIESEINIGETDKGRGIIYYTDSAREIPFINVESLTDIINKAEKE